MNWLKELLEKLGIGTDAATSIVEGVEKNYEGFVPKHRFDEVNNAKKQLEKDLKDRDDQLGDLQKNAGDNQALKDQITKLQDDNKVAADKYAADMSELRLSTALKTALHGKVHDPDIVSSLLDKSKIEIAEDGSIKAGIEDQLKSLQESKAFLFVPEKEESQQRFAGVNPPNGAGRQREQNPLKGYDAGKSIAEQRNQKGSE